MFFRIWRRRVVALQYALLADGGLGVPRGYIPDCIHCMQTFAVYPLVVVVYLPELDLEVKWGRFLRGNPSKVVWLTEFS